MLLSVSHRAFIFYLKPHSHCSNSRILIRLNIICVLCNFNTSLLYGVRSKLRSHFPDCIPLLLAHFSKDNFNYNKNDVGCYNSKVCLHINIDIHINIYSLLGFYYYYFTEFTIGGSIMHILVTY